MDLKPFMRQARYAASQCNISEPLVGDHPVIIPINFGQIPNSGLGEEGV